MPSGGPRSNAPGDPARPNRTDMNRVAPSKGYGDGVAQERLLQAVPLQPAAAPSDMTAGAPAGPPPPRVPAPFDRPTDRPNEPATAGLASGAGPGPEALGLNTTNIEKLRPMLPVLELIASRPETGQDARNFVRRLRGALG